MGLIIAILLVSLYIIYMVIEQRQKEKHADVVFKATMLALENKAKREGTFKVSYFDKE